MDLAYQALLQELQNLQSPGAPPAMFTPDQIRQRIADNNSQMRLGMQGELSGDHRMNVVGGQVFKQALAGRQPRVTSQGELDPLTGDFAESPEFRTVTNEARRGRVLQQALQYEDQRQRAAERASNEQANREMRAQLASDSNALRGQIAEGSNQTRLLVAGMSKGLQNEKFANQQEQQLNTQVTKFGNQLQKEGIPEFDAALGIAEGRLSKHKVGDLPGYGKILSAIPTGLLWGEDSQQTRSDMQQAANILLQSQSGKAVTDSESKRFLTQVAMGAGMSETAMRHGWDNIRRTYNQKLNNALSSVSPEVRKEYLGRGGTDFKLGSGAVPPAEQAEPMQVPGLNLPPGFKLIGPAQ